MWHRSVKTSQPSWMPLYNVHHHNGRWLGANYTPLPLAWRKDVCESFNWPACHRENRSSSPDSQTSRYSGIVTVPLFHLLSLHRWGPCTSIPICFHQRAQLSQGRRRRHGPVELPEPTLPPIYMIKSPLSWVYKSQKQVYQSSFFLHWSRDMELSAIRGKILAGLWHVRSHFVFEENNLVTWTLSSYLHVKKFK